MRFKSILDAKKWFRDYKPFSEEVPFFTYDWDFKDWRFGDWVLFRHIKNYDGETLISRPIYGIFCGFTIWDQALCVNILESNRAWMGFHEYTTVGSDGKEYGWLISGADPSIENFPLWSENIVIMGHWKRKPSLAEIKLALTNPSYHN